MKYAELHRYVEYRVHTVPRKLGKHAIFTKCQVKPGIARECYIIFIQVSKNKLFSPHHFISPCMVICKVAVLFVGKCELYHFT